MYTTMRDDVLHHVRLACVPGIGSRMRRLLIERFGSAEAVFQASPEDLRTIPRLGPTIARELPSPASASEAAAVIDLCRSREVGIILEGDDRYPALLSRIDDPPGPLFVRGELRPCDALAVAIVGARHATVYGLRVEIGRAHV